MGLVRGAFVGTLSLVALRAVTSSDAAASRFGGLFTGAAAVLDVVVNPSTPALPDLRRSATVGNVVSTSFSRTPTAAAPSVSGDVGTSAPSASDVSGANAGVAGVIAEAKKHLGKPYRWGGKGPDVFDCSGFVGYAYKHGANKSITQWTGTQVHVGKKVDSMPDALPGDLLFYGPMPVPTHVVMYLGGGQRIHAPRTGDVVKIDSAIGNPSFIRRVLPATPKTSSSTSTTPRIPVPINA